MNKARFPYGVSNFEKLIEGGYVYIDRTRHIEVLENLSAPYQFFLRPRRFGKSLFLSVLEYYYAQEHRDKFERLFGGLYIGQHPTPLAGKYLVLKFDFSGIETADIGKIYYSFLSAVQDAIESVLIRYAHLFAREKREEIRAIQTPAETMNRLLTFLEDHPQERLLVLIDEYDHFTNELIAFHFDNFQEIVSRNGFVRKFYEVLKKGTQRGVIDRMFITGVSPITLDSLTSGFNIGSNLSLDLELHDLMGFREEEVAQLLHHAGVPEEELPQVLGDVRTWYNGYCFHRQAPHRLYNPDMVLYFAEEYARYRRYPERLLDINVSSDYGKIGRMLRVGDEKANWQLLEQLLEDGCAQAALTVQFSFERSWTRDDFISLLFYLGLLTIREASFGRLTFEVPNRVISNLYYTYFRDRLAAHAALRQEEIDLTDRVIALAKNDDMAPLAETLQTVLERLSNRDARGWSEKHVKAVLMALLVPTGVYGVFSEWPVGPGYADIYLKRRPPIVEPKHEHIIELKYLKKQEAALVDSVLQEGRRQVQIYLSHPDVARQGDVLGWLMLIVGTEVRVERVSAP